MDHSFALRQGFVPCTGAERKRIQRALLNAAARRGVRIKTRALPEGILWRRIDT